MSLDNHFSQLIGGSAGLVCQLPHRLDSHAVEGKAQLLKLIRGWLPQLLILITKILHLFLIFFICNELKVFKQKFQLYQIYYLYYFY